jgi:hypothetical protein
MLAQKSVLFGYSWTGWIDRNWDGIILSQTYEWLYLTQSTPNPSLHVNKRAITNWEIRHFVLVARQGRGMITHQWSGRYICMGQSIISPGWAWKKIRIAHQKKMIGGFSSAGNLGAEQPVNQIILSNVQVFVDSIDFAKELESIRLP